MRSLKILVLSDSLALPRHKPETCIFDNTWPQLLKNSGFTLHQVSLGGGTIIDIFKQSKYHKSFNPDIVIVQAGIVDCAPRFISRDEKYFLTKIPRYGKKVINFLNKPWLRKIRSLTYVKQKEYNKYLKRIVKLYGNAQQIYFCEIVGGEGYENVLPGIRRNIRKYNSILSSIEGTKMINFEQDDITMSDFHHLNRNGHRDLFNQIRTQIELDFKIRKSTLVGS